MKRVVLSLCLVVFASGCGPGSGKDLSLASGTGGVGVGSGDRFESYQSALGFRVLYQSQLRVREQGDEVTFDNRELLDGRNQRASVLKIRLFSDEWLAGKPVNEVTLSEYATERMPDSILVSLADRKAHCRLRESTGVNRVNCVTVLAAAGRFLSLDLHEYNPSNRSNLVRQVLHSLSE